MTIYEYCGPLGEVSIPPTGTELVLMYDYTNVILLADVGHTAAQAATIARECVIAERAAMAWLS